MPDDPPPPEHAPFKDPIVARLLAAGTLITALAGLATALWKPQDQSVTKAAYQQCTVGIEKLNAGLAQEHENVAMIRGYIAAREGQSLLEKNVALTIPFADAGAPAPVSATPASHAPPVKHAQGSAGKPSLAPPPLMEYPPPSDTAAALPPPAPAPTAYHP